MLALNVGAAFGTGLMVGAASMLSIGPNNLMLIRESLRRGHSGTMATTVYVNYVALGLASCLLADGLAEVRPQLRLALSCLGVVALAFFAAQALWTAMTQDATRRSGPTRPDDKAGSIKRALLTVWCNPLTYLERLIVPAVLCAGMAGPSRVAFVAALLLCGAASCYGYAWSGGLALKVFQHDRALRAFDLASGLLLAGGAVAMAGRLLMVSA